MIAATLSTYADERDPATFSDEKGGFVIRSVVGTGAATDPVIIRQAFYSPGPATLVVRSGYGETPPSFIAMKPDYFRSAITFIVRNDTNRPWVGFDFELQQIEDQPSVFSDGLSFDQPGTFSRRPFVSDRFVFLERESEPFDRLMFRDGSVSPGATVTFDVNLVDITPVPEFYLVLQPIIPFS